MSQLADVEKCDFIFISIDIALEGLTVQ